jgi:hypothetical protein
MDEDLIRQFKERAYRLRDQRAAGAEDAELTGPNGVPWHVHRDADGSLRIEQPSAGITSRSWQPSVERPADYPVGVPFLAETAAFTGVATGASPLVMVQWWQVQDAARVLGQLVRDTLEEGWVETEPLSPTTEPVGERCQFVRGRFKRIISRTGTPASDALLLMQVELPSVNGPGDR